MQHNVLRRVIFSGLIGILVLALLAGMAFLIRPYLTRQAADADSSVQSIPSLQDQLLDVSPQAAMLAGVGTLKPIETAFDDWAYPGAQSFETTRMVDETVRQDEQVLAHTEIGACNVLSSDDDFETVVAHYVRQMESLLPSNAGTDPAELGSRYHVGSRLHTFDSGVALVTDIAGDANPYNNRAERRPFDVATLSLQAANCNVTVAISRGPDEDATYIHVIYNEWPVAAAE